MKNDSPKSIILAIGKLSKLSRRYFPPGETRSTKYGGKLLVKALPSVLFMDEVSGFPSLSRICDSSKESRPGSTNAIFLVCRSCTELFQMGGGQCFFGRLTSMTNFVLRKEIDCQQSLVRSSLSYGCWESIVRIVFDGIRHTGAE